jgi:sugar phosphate isomerase/epimerase
MFEIGSQINETRIDGDLDNLRHDLHCFKKWGLTAVEIPPHGLDVIKNGCLDRQRLKAIREILDDYDFHYSIHAPNPMNLMDKERSAIHISVFRASLKFAMEIGARKVVYHAGRYIPEETFCICPQNDLSAGDKNLLLDLEAVILERLAVEFPDVVICLENARPYRHHSPYCYAEDLNALTEQVKRINRENIRICLDCGHLFMSARYFQYDYLTAAAAAKPWIGHIHIHDNFGDAVFYTEKQQTHQIPFGKGDSHMPIGWGIIPFHGILDRVIDGYDGFMIMELRSRYFHHTVASRHTLEKIIASLTEIRTGDAIPSETITDVESP